MKNKKIIVISITTIILCLIVILGVTLFYVLRGEESLHIDAEGIQIEFKRVKLTKYCLGSDGKMCSIVDEDIEDFSKSNQKNVFGLTEKDIVVPSSRYQADMIITSKNNKPFAYWLQIEINEGNPFAEQLLVTVSIPNELEKSYRLSEDMSFGNEQEPLAILESGEISNISVKVYFVDDQMINDAAADQIIYFDLILCAVQI